MITKIKELYRRWRHPRGYVIIYDLPEDGISDTYGDNEQYYGYFSSPEEARTMWNSFKGPGLAEETYQNVKLCRIVEDW